MDQCQSKQTSPVFKTGEVFFYFFLTINLISTTNDEDKRINFSFRSESRGTHSEHASVQSVSDAGVSSKQNRITNMDKTVFLASGILVLSLMGSGCAGMLPSIKQTTKSPWQSFDEAKRDFDKIVPKKTTSEDLKRLGFDPFEVPNVKLVTYLELIERFIPNQSIRMEDLDPGVRDCLKARDNCQGYEITPKMLNSQRYGNVFMDLLNFRRKKITRGWKFNALIVLNKGLVVHKVWGGEPNISEFEDKKNPLGPLQNIDNVLPPIKIFN